MDRDETRGERPSILKIVVLVIQLIALVCAVILGLAFIMGLLGANPDAAFSSWIYDRAASIMTPFNGVFDPINVTGGTQIQVSVLFAMLVYGMVAGILGGVTRRL